MKLQKSILNQYKEINQKPTLKFISEDTGIQLTRVFRLMNGSPMKLEEYEIFKNKVQEKMGLTRGLEALAGEISVKFTPETIKELENFLNRKLELWKLLQTQNDSVVESMTA